MSECNHRKIQVLCLDCNCVFGELAIPKSETKKPCSNITLTCSCGKTVLHDPEPTGTEVKDDWAQGDPVNERKEYDCLIHHIHGDSCETQKDDVEEKIQEIYAYHHDGHVLKETASLDQRLRELVELTRKK